jgi:uncharacterized protein (DUF983 family)
LSRVKGSDFEVLVNEVVLRSQSQAIYTPENIGHFGLNLRRYAHFTSPIRRYADLVVHRALIGALNLGKDGISNEQEGRLDEITALISASERDGRPADRHASGRPAKRGFRRPHLRRHQVRPVRPAAAIRRRRFHTRVNLGRRLLYLRRIGACAVWRTQRKGLSARRRGRGAAGRDRADGRRHAFRHAERAEAPARLEAIFPQGAPRQGARPAAAAPRPFPETMMDQQTFGQPARRERSLMQAMGRGFMGRCPHCGEGKLFRKFLKVADSCDVCGEEYHHHRADDLPAYLVIVVVGHIVVGGLMVFERAFALSMWTHLAIWVPITLVMTIGLLQPTKGAVVGLQWALRMHGFSGKPELLETHPEL